MKKTSSKSIAAYRNLFIVLGVLLVSSKVYSFAADREFYQIKVYHLKDREQEQRVDKFLQNALLPALHKTGIKKVGVFKPVGNDTSSDRRIFVFIPFNTLNQMMSVNERLQKDNELTIAGKDYLEAAYNEPVYTRMETILLEAFPDMPKMQLPQLKGPMSTRIYELRSYESATENLHLNKVQMFNQGGEVKLFKRLGFNAVFYARVLAGSRMPNLMYMTTFEDRPIRDEHWKAFSADPEWKKLSAMPEYKNNVSRNETMFLMPVDYSDI